LVAPLTTLDDDENLLKIIDAAMPEKNKEKKTSNIV